jgi:hypothetical protein
MNPNVESRNQRVFVFLKTKHGFEFRQDIKCLIFGVCIFFITALTGYSDSSQVNVNRTVPKVDPPRSALEFSATPTEDEFFRARVFAEPLVPIGGKPTASENSALAAALLGYAKRSGPDDFSALTDFLKEHPQSPWAAALLTDVGIEY